MNTPTFSLIVVFVLISVRQIGRVRFEIWHIMSARALFLLMMGHIPQIHADGLPSQPKTNLLGHPPTGGAEKGSPTALSIHLS